jgi:hypothetical protein
LSADPGVTVAPGLEPGLPTRVGEPAADTGVSTVVESGSSLATTGVDVDRVVEPGSGDGVAAVVEPIEPSAAAGVEAATDVATGKAVAPAAGTAVSAMGTGDGAESVATGAVDTVATTTGGTVATIGRAVATIGGVVGTAGWLTAVGGGAAGTLVGGATATGLGASVGAGASAATGAGIAVEAGVGRPTVVWGEANNSGAVRTTTTMRQRARVSHSESPNLPTSARAFSNSLQNCHVFILRADVSGVFCAATVPGPKDVRTDTRVRTADNILRPSEISRVVWCRLRSWKHHLSPTSASPPN